METLKWLAVGVFGIFMIVVIAAASVPALQGVGTTMVEAIEDQVNDLVNLQAPAQSN